MLIDWQIHFSMRNSLLLACLLFSVSLFAQDRVSVKGRIVNELGEPVEYVHVGAPACQIGTVSTVDGRFEIAVTNADTLEFHHVSYQVGYYPVKGPIEDVVIVLKDSELQPAVFIGGKTKVKYLLRAGTKVPGGAGDFYRPDGVSKGYELGSVVKTRKPFLIKDILFSIRENHIPGCVAEINIYSIQGEPEEFINILHKPIYANIAMSSEEKDYDIQPEESILLEPGRYFISFALVDCDMDAVSKIMDTPESERDPYAMHLLVPMYFKSSYQRFYALGKLSRFPVNIGISVKGLEYQ